MLKISTYYLFLLSALFFINRANLLFASVEQADSNDSWKIVIRSDYEAKKSPQTCEINGVVDIYVPKTDFDEEARNYLFAAIEANKEEEVEEILKNYSYAINAKKDEKDGMTPFL